MANKKRKDTKGRVLKKGETQVRDNLYKYRWTDDYGKRQGITASSLDKLRELEKTINKEQMLGVSRSSITLNEQIEIYMMTKTKLQPSTRSNYQYYYEHSIKDTKLGKMKITDIKKSDILLFYKMYHEQGYSDGTIKILQRVIRPALQLAVDDNIIVKNPASGCTKEYSEDLEKKYALTFEQEKEFLERVKNRPRMKRYYPMYAIMLKTGLRISEAIGLTWDNVDMENRQISIDHQVHWRTVDNEYT